MDVSKMIMITVITGLVIYAVIDTSDEDAYKYISYFGNVQLDDASFAKVYSKEENAGYEKEIVESGDYKFIVFTRNTEADDFHPDFLCFVEYTGTDMGEYVCYSKTGFQSLEAEEDQFYVGSAGDIRNDLLYIGNLDKGCQFTITMSLLNDDAEIKYDEVMQQAYMEDKGEFPDAEEFAYTVGKVNIIIE